MKADKMDTRKIAGGSEEARLIVDTIVNTEVDAELILQCLEQSKLTGDKLTSYFEDNFADTNASYEEDVHLFASAVKGQATLHRL